jgi:glycosyltransferase involved in cell wall biosynthesis
LRFGRFVTFYPTAGISEEWRDVYLDIPREVEVMLGFGPAGLERFLSGRAHYYDVIFISRPHNMQCLKPILQAHPDWFQNTRILYDAEAVFASRDIAGERLKGELISEKSVEQLMKSEVNLASEADLITSVSRSEAEIFARHGFRNIHVLGHAISADPTPRLFDERSGFLFVGSVLEENSPNGDAVLWFIREILPIIRNSLGDVVFTMAGANKIDLDTHVRRGSLKVLGSVDDLSAVYDQARVFVAPTRFSAGIPHKIHEAAARGVPVVATSQLMRQLGWVDGDDLLVGDTPGVFAEKCIRLHSDAQSWERIRRSALDRVRVECSPESFEATLKSILDETASSTREVPGASR